MPIERPLPSNSVPVSTGLYTIYHPAVASVPPKANYPQSYAVLTLLFAGLAGLFIVLAKQFWDLEGKITEYEKITLDNKLLEILVKSKEERLSVEKTREWLEKDCFLSKKTIDEIMINLEKS